MLKKPNLFIVGGMKCGTTSLQDWLNQHPEIWMNFRGETNFFAQDVEGAKKSMPTNIDWYFSVFKDAKGKYIGEKSARYLYSKEASNKIKKFNPDAKIIILIRKPSDMIYSLFRHLRLQGYEPLQNFRKAVEKENERKRRYGTEFLRNFYYKDMADYFPQIKRFFDEFEKENVKVIVFEEMVNNPKKVYLDILNFLKLPYFKPEFRVLNKTREESRYNFLNKFIYFVQTLSYPLQKIIKILIPLRIRDFIRKMNKKKVETNNPNLEVMKELDIYFEKRKYELEKLLNKDLKLWN